LGFRGTHPRIFPGVGVGHKPVCRRLARKDVGKYSAGDDDPALEGIHIPARVMVRGDKQALEDAEVPRVMGVWGGTSEYERLATVDLGTIQERVRVLMATFPARLEARRAAWLEWVGRRSLNNSPPRGF
jgi:hypothetical protein